MGAEGHFGWGIEYARASIPRRKQILRSLMKEYYHTGKCVKDTIVKGIYYGVYTKSAQTGGTFAVVIEPHVNSREDELITRVEDEGVGPWYAEMPVSYLKLLSPPANQYSKEWRERVIANAKKKSAKKSGGSKISPFVR